MQDGYHLREHRGQPCAALYIGGERKSRIALGKVDRETAERLVRQQNAEWLRKQQPAALTIDGIFELYIADRKREGKAATWRMQQCREVLKERFGALEPDQINKRLCLDHIEQRRNIDVSDATIRTELAYLSAALTFAVDTELIKAKPRIWLPPVVRPRSQVEDFHLTRSQAERLLKATADVPHLHLWVTLALATAGRPLHILQLTWDRVDFHKATINLDDPNRDRTAKGRARVPMNEDARAALTEARRRATSPYVVEFNGKPIKRVKGALARAAKRAGLQVSPYVLRHTAAVWMVEDGVPLEEVAQYLGHTDINTTYRVYARFRPEHLQRAAGSLQVVRGSGGTVVPGNRNRKATDASNGTSA